MRVAAPGILETRLAVPRGPALDLCFQPVSEPPTLPPRLHVTDDGTTYADTGPLAALILDSADPARDAVFWSWLTGWTDTSAEQLTGATRSLRHPSLRGPVLALRPEGSPKSATKNRRHLDLRLETGERPDDVAAGIVERGGAVLPTDWGELPWRSYTDPSGNELCVLPAPS